MHEKKAFLAAQIYLKPDELGQFLFSNDLLKG